MRARRNDPLADVRTRRAAVEHFIANRGEVHPHGKHGIAIRRLANVIGLRAQEALVGSDEIGMPIHQRPLLVFYLSQSLGEIRDFFKHPIGLEVAIDLPRALHVTVVEQLELLIHDRPVVLSFLRLHLRPLAIDLPALDVGQIKELLAPVLIPDGIHAAIGMRCLLRQGLQHNGSRCGHRCRCGIRLRGRLRTLAEHKNG